MPRRTRLSAARKLLKGGKKGGADGKSQGATNQEKGAEFEGAVKDKVGDDFDGQVVFKDRKRLEGQGRPKGSSVVDFCNKGNSCTIEAKSFNLDTPKGVSSLISSITRQAKVRVKNLPEGAKQTVKIDARGRNLSAAKRQNIVDRIVKNSKGAIKPKDIKFFED